MKIGYRIWFPHWNDEEGPWLSSISTDHIWKFNTESCSPPRSDWNHETDLNNTGFEVDPSVGFFSYKDYDEMMDDDDGENRHGFIAGVVGNFNKVVTHEFGYRSESIQILGIRDYLGCDKVDCTNRAIDTFWSNELGGRALISLCLAHMPLYESDPCEVQQEKMLVQDYLEMLANRYECDLMTVREMKELGNENR